MPCFADLAPIRYEGWSLSPKYESSVRLANETVDISWGDICTVKALFTLVNESDSAIDMKAGFPANLTFIKEIDKRSPEGRDSTNRVYDFDFVLNGDRLAASDIPPPKIADDVDQWYGWNCRIRLGTNIVRLRYFVRSSPAPGFGRLRDFFYVIHTGNPVFERLLGNAVDQGNKPSIFLSWRRKTNMPFPRIIEAGNN
jgi:hypothetical protein